MLRFLIWRRSFSVPLPLLCISSQSIDRPTDRRPPMGSQVRPTVCGGGRFCVLCTGLVNPHLMPPNNPIHSWQAISTSRRSIVLGHSAGLSNAGWRGRRVRETRPSGVLLLLTGWRSSVFMFHQFDNLHGLHT